LFNKSAAKSAQQGAESNSAAIMHGADLDFAAQMQALRNADPLQYQGPGGMAQVFDPESRTLAQGFNAGSYLHNQKVALGNLFNTAAAGASDPNFVGSEVDRLREIARPQEDRTRAALQSRLFSQGRLGAGIGGGRTGQFYNPETAALEEAFANVDLNRVAAARGEQQRLFGNSLGASEMLQNLFLLPAQATGMSQRPGGTISPGFANAAAQGANFTNQANLFGLGQQVQQNKLFGQLGGSLFGNLMGSFAQPQGNAYAQSLGNQFASTGGGF